MRVADWAPETDTIELPATSKSAVATIEAGEARRLRYLCVEGLAICQSWSLARRSNSDDTRTCVGKGGRQQGTCTLSGMLAKTMFDRRCSKGTKRAGCFIVVVGSHLHRHSGHGRQVSRSSGTTFRRVLPSLNRISRRPWHPVSVFEPRRARHPHPLGFEGGGIDEDGVTSSPAHRGLRRSPKYSGREFAALRLFNRPLSPDYSTHPTRTRGPPSLFLCKSNAEFC